MLATHTAIKYTEKYIGRYLFLGIIVFVMTTIFVIVYCICNAELNNIAVVDTIELTCDININERDEINVHKLTVAGYLRTDEVYTERIPLVVIQSFVLITNGNIEGIENIALSVYINGDMESVKYDSTYAILEEVNIGGNGMRDNKLYQ